MVASLVKEKTMIIRLKIACAASCLALLPTAPSANALTMQECSAKYKAAQASGALKGQKWNDFRKAECGADAALSPAAAPAAPAPNSVAAKPAPSPKPAVSAAPMGTAVF